MSVGAAVVLVLQAGIAQGGTLTGGTAYPAWHQTTAAALRFGERVAETTGGKVKVVLQHSGALGLERELAQRVSLGTLDLTAVTAAELAPLVPEMALFQLPYLFRNYEHLFVAIDQDLSLRKYCESALDRKGFKLLALVGVSYRAISGHSPINALADLRGKKIRVQDDRGTVGVFELLGAVPVVLPLPEVATSLRTGTVEFAEGSLIVFAQGKLYETIKHVADVRHTHQVAALVMSKTSWSKQDAVTQKAIIDAGRDAAQDNRKPLFVEDNALKAQLGGKGVTITKPDPAPFRVAAKRLYDEFYASPAGKDARKLVELILGLR